LVRLFEFAHRVLTTSSAPVGVGDLPAKRECVLGLVAVVEPTTIFSCVEIMRGLRPVPRRWHDGTLRNLLSNLPQWLS